ncbi:MAG: hypothetical protein KY463_01190 [Actinobacteria bacterium]|nr:hypothetical protein [Actinomycetota bacterium]
MRFPSIYAGVVVVGLVFAGSAQAALKAPGLEAPAAGSSVEGLPTFKWRSVKGAAHYEFQLSADARFGSIVLGKGAGRGSQRTRNTAATLTKSVPDGKYHWRVRAISKRDRAGRWSSTRTVTKAWKTAPSLLSPAADAPIAWPSAPLVLRWSPVHHATKYLVTIATDPSLAQSVIGAANKPVETLASVYTLQGTLPAGRYYWAITPVDAEGHRGARSAVGSFTWSWPTGTAARFVDLNDTAAVVDPLLDWDAVQGAARYEVEINPDDDFAAGSRVCCKDRVLGTSLSPLRVLPNNNDFSASSGYHWRVRAFDADDNPGQWNRGPTFEKSYDDVTPTVPGLAVETVTTADAATASPLVTWGAVPGAAQYQVQWTVHTSGGCGWSNASGPIKTSALGWTPLSPNRPTGIPGGIGITSPAQPARFGQPFSAERASSTSVHAFADGVTYCLRVRALSDDAFRENDSLTSQVISRWTQVGGSENAPAFTYGAPPASSSDPAAAIQLPAPAYGTPVGGQVSGTPVLRWAPVAGARRYFVLIARDSNFTNVVDAAFTAMPAYVPNRVLEDEATSYFWAVIPASQSDGSGISGGPTSYDPQNFRKLSIPPNLVEPGSGAQVATQPRFRWTPVDGAQKYNIQVSADPQFGSLLDNVVTAATAYTSQTPYPADTALYWRVRAEQLQVLASGRVEMRWSATGSFRRALPAPVLAGDNPTQGELIPVFSWSPVPGAISYDLHAEEADGDAQDFTVKSSAFAPTKYTGTGILHYKVRANFATRSGKVASAYSPAAAFTRIIGSPPGPRMTRSKTRLVFGWGAAAAAAHYRVEVSTSDSFTRLVESVKTDNTNWAPDLTKPAYRTTGPLYWRVASVDADNNVGAFTTKQISKGKAMSVLLRGTLRRGSTRSVRAIVRGSNRKALSGAKVKVGGAGVRSPTKTTNKRGITTFRLRPTKSGMVTFTVTRAGYANTTKKLRVR